MSGIFEHGLSECMNRVSTAFGSVADNMRSAATERIEHLGAAWRAEVRRVTMAMALAMILAFMTCAAVAFAMFALMLSFWEPHRIPTAWLVTAILAAVAWLAATLLRKATAAESRDE